MYLYIPNPLLVFVLFTSVSNLSAIRCYQCGSESIFMHEDDGEEPLPKSRAEELENTLLTLESCSNLEFPFSSWGSYAVDCAPEQICVKTIIDDGFDESGRHRYVTGSRGCAMRNTSQGQNHIMGCGILKTNVVPPTETFQNTWDVVCFCDDDYCNRAQRTGVTFSPTIVLLVVSSCFWRILN